MFSLLTVVQQAAYCICLLTAHKVRIVRIELPGPKLIIIFGAQATIVCIRAPMSFIPSVCLSVCPSAHKSLNSARKVMTFNSLRNVSSDRSVQPLPRPVYAQRAISYSSIFLFPLGHPVAPYVFFLVFPSLLSFPVPFLH